MSNLAALWYWISNFSNPFSPRNIPWFPTFYSFFSTKDHFFVPFFSTKWQVSGFRFSLYWFKFLKTLFPRFMWSFPGPFQIFPSLFSAFPFFLHDNSLFLPQISVTLTDSVHFSPQNSWKSAPFFSAIQYKSLQKNIPRSLPFRPFFSTKLFCICWNSSIFAVLKK